MAITTRDQLINALANNSSRIIIDKAAPAGAAIGFFHSYWRSLGQPGQGAIPGAAAVCDMSTAGALGFAPQTAPVTSYLAIIEAAVSQAGGTVEIHDRLAHMGGLSGTVTTAQTVGLDLNSLLSSSNLMERVGTSDYSDVQWWLEWYANTGATNSNATVNVTYSDGTTGNLTALAIGTNVPAQRMLPLNTLMPAGTAGKYIRGVNSVQLSASTGTAGSFGITATRYRSGTFCPLGNARITSDWAQTGLPGIPNDSCLFPVLLSTSSTVSTIRATGKIVHG